jgi:hypothetical protein
VNSTGHGFATSGNDQSVVMLDLKSYKVFGGIPAAEDANAIIHDSVLNRVFTFNGDAHSSTVIDPGPGTPMKEYLNRSELRPQVQRTGRFRDVSSHASSELISAPMLSDRA